MSDEYERLLDLIEQCGQQTAKGIVHKADREETYLAARIVNGLPVDIQRFATPELADRHVCG